MENKTPIAIFASGTGSNFEAIVQAKLPCKIVKLVCDKPDAPVIEKAEKLGISILIIDSKQFTNKEAFEEEILTELKKVHVKWIFLAGYMRLIGQSLLKEYKNQIVNIHPSLLPEFPGKDAIQQAYDKGVKKTGVSVHYVDEGMDTGVLIHQEELSILDGESIESLEERIHKLEHKIYPEVILNLIT